MTKVYEKIKPKIENKILSNYGYRENIIKEYYPQLKLIRSERRVKRGYCFNYALNDYSDILSFYETIFEFVKDHYKHINLDSITIGDLVTIHDDTAPSEYNVQHYAKIIKTDNTLEGTIIRSKWGELGIWQGKLEDIPDIYGDVCLFWRRK